MGSSSKELLQLEHNTASSLESLLSVCKKDAPSETKQHPPADDRLTTAPVAPSQVLGKVKDFLGVISEANKRLQEDAKDNSEKHDIEALTGNESEVIEMNLMLGVADLHTSEAVAAAESAVSAGQSLIPLMGSSSEEESEDTSDDSETDNESHDDDSDNDMEESSGEDDGRTDTSRERDTSKSGNRRSKKQPKIIELS